MVLVDYHLLGYVPTETDFHRIIHAKSAGASALYGGDSQLAQSILHMIDYGNESGHVSYKNQLANGTAVNSNSQARKDVAYIHSLYYPDIEARNPAPLPDEVTIKKLIDDLVKSNNGNKEARTLKALIDGEKADWWNHVHNVYLNFKI